MAGLRLVPSEGFLWRDTEGRADPRNHRVIVCGGIAGKWRLGAPGGAVRPGAGLAKAPQRRGDALCCSTRNWEEFVRLKRRTWEERSYVEGQADI